MSIKKTLRLVCLTLVYVCISSASHADRKSGFSTEDWESVSSDNWRTHTKFLIDPVQALIIDRHLELRFDSGELSNRAGASIERPAETNPQQKIDFPLAESGLLTYKGAAVEPGVGNIVNRNLLAPFRRISSYHIDKENDPVSKAVKIFWGFQARTNKASINNENTEKEAIAQPHGVMREYKLFAGGYQPYQYLPRRADLISFSFREFQYGPESGNKHLKDYQLLSFTKPAALNELSYFAAQHVSLSTVSPNIESQFSIYSPLLLACRDVLSENQSDPLLGTAFSFRDFFIFSELPFNENLKKIRSSVMEEKSVFVPIVKVGSLAEISEIAEISNAASNAASNATAIPIAPRIDAFQVNLKDVWVVRVDYGSPLSSVAYSNYYIGKENFLPYYKINYDFSGKPISLIILSWGILNTAKDTPDEKVSALQGLSSSRIPHVIRYDAYDMTESGKPKSKTATPGSHQKVTVLMTSVKQQMPLDYLSERFDRLCGSSQKDVTGAPPK